MTTFDQRSFFAFMRQIERMPNTASGNPRWRALTNKGAFETEPDTQVAHALDNQVYPEDLRRITLNADGRVVAVARAYLEELPGASYIVDKAGQRVTPFFEDPTDASRFLEQEVVGDTHNSTFTGVNYQVRKVST